MNLNEKLAAITTTENGSWQQDANWRKANREWLKKAAYVAVTVLGELRRRQMTQKELAERMGLSPQQINKIVKGRENLTLETIVKLERALEIQLIGDVLYQPKATFVDLGSHKQYIMRFWDEMRSVRTQLQVGEIAISIGETSASHLNSGISELHTVYPVPGKEKWSELHPTFS